MNNCLAIFLIRTKQQSILEFPIRYTGLGKCSFGRNAFLENHLDLRIAKGAQLNFGDYCRLGKYSSIWATKDAYITIGDHFLLGSFSEIIVKTKWEILDHVKIGSRCQIFARESVASGNLFLGNGTHVGDGTLIDVTGNVRIESSVALGPNCILYTHDHDYRQHDIIAPWHGKPLIKDILIEDGAWVGSNVTVLPGVTIGKGAIVAAGSVVTRNVEPFSVYGGIPAKLIKLILR